MSRLRDLLIKRRSEVTPLIHWDFSGKNNADAGTIVEDLTGNGYDLELKNFALDNVSGYNGYPINLKSFVKTAVGNYDGEFPINIYENKVVFNGTIAENKTSCAIQGTTESIVQTFAIKITGLGEKQCLKWYNYKYDVDESADEVTLLYNGINFVDGSGTKSKYLGYYSTNDGNVGKTLNNVTVEIFPLYPDQLVFNNTKAQTVKPVKINTTRGFTVIFRRQFIKENIKTVVLGQQGTTGTGADFYIRDYRPSADGEWMVYNFGTNNTLYNHNSIGNLMWSTLSKFFNGQVTTINRPKVESPDDTPLMLGSYTYNSAGNGNFAVREVYIFDRDLTQYQIEKFISDNMIPLPEVYYDVQKQGTLNEHTTKDKLIDFSGNQHHGTLHNFTFDESNGWGYIPNKSFLDLYTKSETSSFGTATFDGKIMHCTKVGAHAAGAVIIDGNTNNPVENVSKCKIKVTGMSNTGISISIGYTNLIKNSEDQTIEGTFTGKIFIDIGKDGEYIIPAYTSSVKEGIEGTPFNYPLRVFWSNSSDTDTDCNITVEILPTDEDYLRFNNASQTYVDIDTLTKGFKTVFMVTEPQKSSTILYDQRINPDGLPPFAIYNKGIAYNERNNGGVTYINGELNTSITAESLTNVKHCLTIVNDTVTDDNSTTPVIGDRTDHSNYYQFAATMKVYKFLGFKEALSEKQIKMVIEKYGLQVD